MLLHERIAIVSGSGPGLGRDIALAFAREGADVVLAARSPDRLEAIAEEVRARGRRALAVPTDITDPQQCKHLAEATVAEFGRIDVLVNNAFVQPAIERLEDADAKTWQTTFKVNVFGAVEMTKAVLPAMRARQRGSIVFVNSMSSRRVHEGFGVYSASKAALMTTAQHFANELGQDGIRVNSVVPGYIYGPSVQWWFQHQATERGVEPQQVYDEVASETALRHLPTPEEIADSVVYLASDLSRAVTGQAVDVNGGHWFH